MKKIFTLLFAAACAANVMATSDDNIVRYDFENYRLIDIEDSEYKYYGWFEKNSDGTEDDLWASGNPAFGIALFFSEDKSPEAFPTVAVQEGYEGACVKLETKSTGTLAASFGMGLAAGNMFIGNFDSENAVTNPMGATQFGKPFYRKPVKFTGYYKYTAGAEMVDAQGNAVNETDKGQIYSVLYRNTDNEGNPVVLHGDDVFTNPNIVAVANAGDITDVAEWTPFEVEYDYKDNVIDEDILKAGGYSMTVVFSSSAKGAAFIGAVGSTMYVDKVAVVCEPEPKEYTGNLVVKMQFGSFPEQKTSIYITEQLNGKYTLSLKNFKLGENGVGTIIVKDVEGTEENGNIRLSASQDIKIEEGDDPDVQDWMGPELPEVPVVIDAIMSDTQLNATITINYLGGIDVEFSGVPTGISNVVKDRLSAKNGIYNINGAKVSNMQPGQVYILRKADGTSVKVVKK